MAAFRLACTIVLSLLLIATSTRAADQPQAATPGLYERPTLVIDPGMHTAVLKGASVDAQGRWAVTGSYDKTVRVWSLSDGALARTFRLPAGPGEVGQALAVAISPNAALIAVGGWTRNIKVATEQIYLLDRQSGALVRRIEGLPGAVTHLTFSPDGKLLAATLSVGGLRIYSSDRDWGEAASDTESSGASFGADFGPGGRLATTSRDGPVRLYRTDHDALQNLRVGIRPAAAIAVPDGREPFGVAFNPDGSRLAVGSYDSPIVDLLDGGSLTPLPAPDLRGINRGNLDNVAWSKDGRTLFAGGTYGPHDVSLVLAWDNAGSGRRRVLATVPNTITNLVPRPTATCWWPAPPPRSSGSALTAQHDGRTRNLKRI